MTAEVIKSFESNYRVSLPADYVLFFTNINGGAGPFYGLEPFENVLFNDLDYRRPHDLLDPAKPFFHTKPWNFEFHPTVSEENDEKEYEKQDVCSACVRLAIFGTGSRRK